MLTPPFFKMAPIEQLIERAGLGLGQLLASTAVPPCTTTALALYTGPGLVVTSLQSNVPTTLGLVFGLGGGVIALILGGLLVRFLVRRRRSRRLSYALLDMESPYYSELSLLVVSYGVISLMLWFINSKLLFKEGSV